MFQAGNPRRMKIAPKYERLIERRERLMQQFSKGEIDRRFYLKEMGAISLKADRKAKRIGPEEEVVPSSNINVSIDSESNDSLSETRPFGEESEDSSCSDQEAPSNRPQRSASSVASVPVALRPGSKKKKASKKQICPSCRKSFQLKRSPPLHISCTECGKLYHKRCRNDVAVKFICQKCRIPSVSTVSVSCDSAVSAMDVSSGSRNVNPSLISVQTFPVGSTPDDTFNQAAPSALGRKETFKL